MLIEECLYGEEASILALCDGKTIVPLVSSQDHKRVGDGDTGLNTGGMGAYSPAPVVDDGVWRQVHDEILTPFLKGVQAEKLDFRGVIFVGIMVCGGKPKVLEFNVRFGDPEIQPVLRRFDGDWFDVLDKVAHGRLAEAELVWSDDPAVSVVLASGGYPGDYEKGSKSGGSKRPPRPGLSSSMRNRLQRRQNRERRRPGPRRLRPRQNHRRSDRQSVSGGGQNFIQGGFCRRDIGAKALKYSK